MASTSYDLQRRLRPFRRRLQLRDALGLAQRSAWVPGAGFIAIQIAGRLLPIPDLLLWSLVPLAVWALAMLLLSLRRPSPATAARRTDLLLDLRERFSTALELSDKIDLDEVEELQRSDALATAQRVQARQIPWALDRRSVAWFWGPLLLGAALVFLPNPQTQVLAERAAVQASVDEAVKGIERQAEELAQNIELSAAERERLLQELEALKRELQASRDNREEALAKLSTAEAQLRRRLDPQADARRAGMEQLSRRLQQEQGGQQPAGASRLDEQLQQLADELASLSEQQRESLAESLEQQAGEMVSSDPSLAQALQRAAEALRNGDNAAASQSLNDAAQQAAAANQQLADNAANEQTLSQLQERREQVAQAGRRQQAQPGQQAQQGQQGQGQGQGQNQGQGQGQGQGQNQGQGQGQGQNQGQGQGQNQGQGTGGSNADNLGDGTSGNSGNVGGNGPGQDFTDGRERGDTVYQPYRPAAQNGEQSQVGGQQGQQGSEQVRPGQFGPGAANGSQVPYEDVYGDYSNAANEALDRSAIPPHLKGYVRDYFSELEPE